MNAPKPILFIHPLSEALEKLLEEVKEIQESENLQIYELNDLNEINQSIPNLGASFTIVSSPKKCASILTTHKNYIKNNKCKIILLSPKPIPSKIVQRLEKLGLTECIVEPVQQKTLFYKAKIHIKSIKLLVKKQALSLTESKADEQGNENEELKVKTLMQKVAETKEKALKESKLKEENEGRNKSLNKLEEDQDDSIDEFDNLMGSNSGAEKLDTNMKGQSQFQENKLDDLIGESNFREKELENMTGETSGDDKLNGNMSGETSSSEKSGDKMSGATKASDKLDGNMSGKASAADNLDANMSGKTSSSDQLDGNMSGETSSSEKSSDKMSGPTKASDKLDGNMSGETSEADKLAGLSGKSNFKEKESGPLKGDQKQDKEKKESPFANMKKPKPQKLSSNMAGKIKKKDPNEVPEKRESPFEKMKREKEEAERNRPKEDLQQTKNNSAAPLQKDPLTEHENENHADALDAKTEELNKPEIKQEEMNLEAELPEKTEKEIKKEALRDKLLDVQETYDKKKEAPKTSAQYKHDKLKPKEEVSREELEKKKLQKEIAPQVEKDQLKKEQKALESDTNETTLNKEESLKNNEKKSTENDLGYSLKEEEKNQSASESESQKEILKTTGELKYAQKVDLGEQTINYDQLDKENGGISTDRVGEKSTSGFEDNTVTTKETVSTITKTPAIEKNNRPENNGKDYTVAKPPIIEAKPNGLDHLIDVFSFYFDKTKTQSDILSHITKYLDEISPAKVIFIQCIYTKEKDLLFTSGFSDSDLKDVINLNKIKWEKIGLPTWYDQTFQTENNTFLFPFYSGITSLGYVYIDFSEKITSEEAKQVEVTLEGARGIYQELLDQSQGKVKQKGSSLNPFRKAS